MKTKAISHRLKCFVKWLFSDALNITVVTRKWRVAYGDWSGGMFECFWFKHNAMKFAKTRNELFVDVVNEITGKYIRIRNNPNNVEAPAVHIYI